MNKHSISKREETIFFLYSNLISIQYVFTSCKVMQPIPCLIHANFSHSLAIARGCRFNFCNNNSNASGSIVIFQSLHNFLIKNFRYVSDCFSSNSSHMDKACIALKKRVRLSTGDAETNKCTPAGIFSKRSKKCSTTDCPPSVVAGEPVANKLVPRNQTHF